MLASGANMFGPRVLERSTSSAKKGPGTPAGGAVEFRKFLSVG